MAHLDIEPLTSFVPTILVVHKEGRRRIENDKEIFEALRRQFKAGAAVEYHDAAHIGNETLKMKVRHPSYPGQVPCAMLKWAIFCFELLVSLALHHWIQ